MPLNLGWPVPEKSWDEIYNKITDSEDEMHKSDQSVSMIFKITNKIGENQDAIQPWVDLIPNEYGMSVVKSAIALILKVLSPNLLWPLKEVY